ncbi:hypothetical protein TSMEX_011038 [Taenia solium]|eukprot:TsM_001235700 transcript=TsM_001235700 gene=TsM_001235700
MTTCYADADSTTTTYKSPSSIPSTRVKLTPPFHHQHEQHQWRQQHVFNTSIGTRGPTQFAQPGRVPWPTATVANTTSKLSVVSSMLPNEPLVGVSQPTPVEKPESELNESTVPLVVAAPTSVATAAASPSTGTSSAHSMTTATSTVPSSSS